MVADWRSRRGHAADVAGRGVFLSILFSAAMGACRPPEAPAELDDLCAFLYARHPDDDAAWMEAGVEQLRIWLDARLEEGEDGYEVTGLDDETVDALDGADRNTEGILGVAVTTASEFAVGELQEAVLVLDQAEISPDNYLEFERTWLTDLDCFLARSCPRLDTSEQVTSQLGPLVTSEMVTSNEYLWVDLDDSDDPVLVQRSWLPAEPTLNVDWLVVHEQFYVNAFVPRPGGSYRLQATWIVAGQDVMPESGVMNMIVDGQQQNAANLETWLEENVAR